MFFRLKRSKSGEVLQLVESYRNAQGKPRHRVVVSLGDAAITRSDWHPIAKAVQKQLYGMEELFAPHYTRRQQNWIELILRRIEGQGRWRARRGQEGERAVEEKAIDGVLVDRVDHSTTGLLLGPILLGLKGWEELRMEQALKQVGFNRAQAEAAKVSVINRLVNPMTENALAGWVSKTALGDLLGEGVLKADRHRYYRVSDRLVENREKLEEHLRQCQGELFDLDRTLLLYDLTNTHFEGVCASNPKAKRGRNKQKRHDCPQIVVGMVFDTEGFALGHRIFAGNRNDSTTLLEMIGELDKAVGSEDEREKTLIIMDGGIDTKDNVQLLREERFGYLVNESRRQRGAYRKGFLEEEGFEKVEGREEHREVQVKWMQESVGEGNGSEADKDIEQEEPAQAGKEYVVLCKSERRRAKEEAIYSGAEGRFLEALEALRARLDKGNLCDQEKIQRAIGRVQGDHSRVQCFYDIELTELRGGGKEKKWTLRWSRKEQAYAEESQLLGCYVLRTNRKDLSGTKLWQLYMTLTRAEDGFKALKSDLGLRPNHHHLETRVEAHVFITILAYHLLRFIQYTLERHGDNRCWKTIKALLETHTYGTVIMPTRSGEVHRVRKAGIPEHSHKQIYNLFQIDWKNLPAKKTVVRPSRNTNL